MSESHHVLLNTFDHEILSESLDHFLLFINEPTFNLPQSLQSNYVSNPELDKL